jgi:hypothetical protein
MKTILTTILVTMGFALTAFAQNTDEKGMPLFWIREDGKYGYIDKAGKVVIPPQYENTMGFNEGLAATKKDGKYGYIDTKGKWVIKPQFEFTYKFSDGLAMVRFGKQYAWIDMTGKTVIQPRDYEEVAQGFKEGRLAVKQNGKWGYIDKTGRAITEIKYKKAAAFSGGVAQVETEDGMHHWITTEGKLIWSQNPAEKKASHAAGHGAN